MHDNAIDPLFRQSVSLPATAEEAWWLRNAESTLNRLASGNVQRSLHSAPGSMDGSSQWVAGGTLLRTQWEAGAVREPQQIVSLGHVAEMHGVTAEQETIAIGAAMALAEMARHPAVCGEIPLLAAAIRHVAAPSVRQLATVGGNIVWGIGDLVPALLALDAELLWYDGKMRLLEPLESWLQQVKSGQSASSRKLLLRICIPKRMLTTASYEKVGRREAFTPSVVTVAMTGTAVPHEGWQGVRIAAGGLPTVPMRLRRTEALLEGTRLTPELIAQTAQVAYDEYEPEHDAFASIAYRKRTAANLIAADLWRRWKGGTR